MAHVRAHGGEYSAETIVYLLRQSLLVHDTPFFEQCGRLLIGSEESDGHWHGGHCEGVVVNLANSFGFLRNPELMREFRINCPSEMWKAIHDGLPFWEMRFGLAFRQKCIDVARSLSRSMETAEEEDLSGAPGEHVGDIDKIADPDKALVDDEVVARLSSPIHQRVLLDAVRGLPRRQAAAALLTWVEGRQIEGPGAETVSSLMEITPRGVRLLLAKARKTLLADPTVRAIRFEEV
jgi:hypothetical protein